MSLKRVSWVSLFFLLIGIFALGREAGKFNVNNQAERNRKKAKKEGARREKNTK